MSKCLTGLYILEGMAKVIAMGFVLGENVYLKNMWNILDFSIIIAGILEIFDFNGAVSF
jgi:hypothetical protein